MTKALILNALDSYKDGCFETEQGFIKCGLKQLETTETSTESK